jgi:A/G-specific adenine glycosylase
MPAAGLPYNLVHFKNITMKRQRRKLLSQYSLSFLVSTFNFPLKLSAMPAPKLSKNREAKTSQLVTALLNWFAQNARDLPWRRTNDPYAIWVSEIMLQQTQVKTVIPYWERWLRELPTIEAAAKARPAKIHKLWEGLGYYTRVRNLQKAAQIIIEKHAGKFPNDFNDVLALPGIGRYTAGAICSIAFNQPTPILDGNVIRVLTRIFGIEKNPREKEANKLLWKLAEKLAQQAQRNKKTKCSCSHLNQSLMELGALVCTPRQPRCLFCPAKKICVALKQNRVETLPNLDRRETVTRRRFVAFVMENRGKFHVRQRPEGVVNAHLWEFPNVEIFPSKDNVRDIFRAEFSFTPSEFQKLCTIKHSITRYRITVDAWIIRMDKPPKNVAGSWFTPKQINRLAFTSAHKKLASAAVDCILSDR